MRGRGVTVGRCSCADAVPQQWPKVGAGKAVVPGPIGE